MTTLCDVIVCLSDDELVYYGQFAFAAAVIALVCSIGYGIQLLLRARRHRIALAKLNSTIKGAEDIMDVMARRFIERNTRITRYGDRRFRDGIATSELPPREVESF